MRKFTCTVCGFVYAPEKGLPEDGIPPGTPFEVLPPDFCCPVCGADKSCFSPLALSGGDDSEEPVHLQATVQEVIPRTPSIKSFRFATPNRATFKPGQYVSISLENEVDLTRYLSISSSPTEEGYLEVTKRITQSRFSQILNGAEPGYHVSITYPMGTFTFEGEFAKIALPDYRERQFYLCGPPPMVHALTEVLRSELQLPEAQVKTEDFIGY